MAVEMKRCVLIGAGPVEDIGLFLSRLCPNDFIACADGGAAHLRDAGRVPNLLAGDFDSLTGTPAADEIITLPREKDDTDAHFTAMLLLGRGFRDFLFLGMTGGRLDHTLAGIATAAALTRAGCRVIIADERSEMTLLHQGSLTLAPVAGAAVSVFAFGGDALGVMERGMTYSLTNARLTPYEPIGVSNEFTEENAMISVEKGMLLILLTKTEKKPEPSFPLLRII